MIAFNNRQNKIYSSELLWIKASDNLFIYNKQIVYLSS